MEEKNKLKFEALVHIMDQFSSQTNEIYEPSTK